MIEEKAKNTLKGPGKNTRVFSSYWLYLIMAFVAVIILVGGYLFYHGQEEYMRQRVEAQLSTVAQLKSDQIVEWRTARLVDAKTLAGPSFTDTVEAYLASPTDTALRARVIADFTIIAQSYPYQDILLVDVNGKLLLNLSDSVHRLSDITLSQLVVAIREHKAIITDFHYYTDSDTPHLDVIAPLFPWGQDSPQPLGAVILCVDPAQYLYPLIQSGPVTSETAETLLVERDGDQVLFLNELRHQKDTALKWRIPLSQQNVPAVMAILGKEGVFQGRDYRGVEVLSYLKHIPDSPWYMVAKIDTSEALSAWHFRSGIIIAAIMILLSAALALVGLFWQRRQRLLYQALYQAEVEAQALRSHFEYLVKYANDIILLADENKHLVEVNDRALEAYGCTRAEMLGMPLANLTPQEDRLSYQERLHKIQQEGMIVTEAIHQRKDGATFPVEISGRTIKIEDKTYLQNIIRDITERKQQEEKLKHLNLTLRAIRNVNQLIVNETDRDRLIQHTCENLIATRGYYSAWIVLLNESGKVISYAQAGMDKDFIPMKKLLKQDKLPACCQKELKQSGAVITQDTTSTCADCPLASKHANTTAVTNRLEQDGTASGFITVTGPRGLMADKQELDLFKEVTNDIALGLNKIRAEEQRQQAEKELQIAIEQWQTTFNAINDAVYLLDNEHKIIRCNRAMEKLLGKPADEIIGHLCWEAVHQTQESIEGCPMVLMKQTQKRETMSRTVGSKHFEFTADPIVDKNGGLAGAVHFITDITELKHIEEERRQLEQKAQITSRLASVGEMTAGVAHEINNPLTAVIGYAQLITNREDVPSDIKGDLAAIADGAQRVASIVKRLLAFSRQTKPQRKLVDINELIESTLALRAYHLRNNNIELVTRLTPDLPDTAADPGQIQQVLLNLIVNAEKEMTLAHGKGKLTVTTEKSDNTIKIYCRDDGLGIKPEVMERIFDPFFTTREIDQGTGLGLSLCHGIIAEHQGKIYAESTPGKGATFIVELPIVNEDVLPKPSEPIDKKPQKTVEARILVVDDEQSVRDIINRVLSSEGYTIETSESGADALKKIEGSEYNLILLDVKMPGMSGIELYKRIEKQDKSPARKVIFITGDVMSTDTEKFLSKTASARIAKPFDPEHLKRVVSDVLARNE